MPVRSTRPATPSSSSTSTSSGVESICITSPGAAAGSCAELPVRAGGQRPAGACRPGRVLAGRQLVEQPVEGALRRQHHRPAAVRAASRICPVRQITNAAVRVESSGRLGDRLPHRLAPPAGRPARTRRTVAPPGDRPGRPGRWPHSGRRCLDRAGRHRLPGRGQLGGLGLLPRGQRHRRRVVLRPRPRPGRRVRRQPVHHLDDVPLPPPRLHGHRLRQALQQRRAGGSPRPAPAPAISKSLARPAARPRVIVGDRAVGVAPAAPSSRTPRSRSGTARRAGPGPRSPAGPPPRPAHRATVLTSLPAPDQRRRAQPFPHQVGHQLPPPHQVEQHRQHRQPVPGLGGPGQQRRRPRERLPAAGGQPRPGRRTADAGSATASARSPPAPDRVSPTRRNSQPAARTPPP